jgi:SHS2 domain-containing protein
MSFAELEHTADVRMEVRAPTLGELFSEAARALMHVMYGAPGAGRDMVFPLALEEEEIVPLMHAFLSEVLFISEVESVVITAARVEVQGGRLEGDLVGERYSPERHCCGQEVKGISLSGLDIVRDEGSYRLTVIFDV